LHEYGNTRLGHATVQQLEHPFVSTDSKPLINLVLKFQFVS